VIVAALATRVPPRRLRFGRVAAFFLVIALAGSLPLFVIPRQKIRYMLQAFPFFMMCLACVTEPAAIRIESVVARAPRARVVMKAAAALLLVGAIVSMFAMEGVVTRNHEFYEDVYLQDLPIRERSRMTVYPEPLIRIGGGYLFQHMQRYLKVSVTPDPGQEYLLVRKGVRYEIPDGYRQINREPILRYRVYARDSGEPPTGSPRRP
jgi:hypothetical protein